MNLIMFSVLINYRHGVDVDVLGHKDDIGELVVRELTLIEILTKHNHLEYNNYGYHKNLNVYLRSLCKKMIIRFRQRSWRWAGHRFHACQTS